MRNIDTLNLSDYGTGLPAARLPGESFEHYQARRTKENKRIRQYLKGTVIYRPWLLGPYRKEK